MIRAFLTPSAPGKPAEVVAIHYDHAPPQFVAPVSPWAVNEKQLGDLRTAVTEAETALRHATSRRAASAEITRLQKELTSAKRELDTVEYELRRNRQRQQMGGDAPFARQSLAEQVASTVAGVAPVVKKVQPLPCNASPRCTKGPGHYKCARCRAAAASTT
jgi:hypothetical protein